MNNLSKVLATCLLIGSVAIVCCLSGCGPVQYVDNPAPQSSPAPVEASTVTNLPNDPTLTASVKAALKGHKADAAQYAGLYETYWDLVAKNPWGWKYPSDIVADLASARGLLDLKHADIPEFTAIATKQLTHPDDKGQTKDGFAGNQKLDETYQAWWVLHLGQLAYACREAAK